MRYIEIILLKHIPDGRDRLGNPVMKQQEIVTGYRGRLSGIPAIATALDGRDVTESSPELLTDAPVQLLRHADGIRIHGQDFRITGIYAKLRGNFTLVQLEKSRDRERRDQHENHDCT